MINVGILGAGVIAALNHLPEIANAPGMSSYGTAGQLIKDGDEIQYIRPGSADREWAEPIVKTISPPDAPSQHQDRMSCIEYGQHPELSNPPLARHVTEYLLAAETSNSQDQRIQVESHPRNL